MTLKLCLLALLALSLLDLSLSASNNVDTGISTRLGMAARHARRQERIRSQQERHKNQVAAQVRRNNHSREGKICIGTKDHMSVPNNRDHHYRNLRDRYTNCTYVDGNLELTWLQDEHLDLSFLQHIREVTGYVLISHVHVSRIVLPSLQIIRGRILFNLSPNDFQKESFALIITLSKMHTLELPALRDILEGSVGIINNYNLCHIKTIEWDEIITGKGAKVHYLYKFQEPERDCTPCHESCEAGCWGEGAHNCQKFSKMNCSPQCGGGRCFGPRPRECCHQYCAGGCTGPTQSDCLACTNFYDDGVCKQECPPMQRYNQVKYRWERNPNGKYAYGATCVKDCPKHLLKDNGACVRACPPKKKSLNGECVPCDGPCPKICHFDDAMVHAGNIDSLENCTVIEGSVTILDNTFKGYQDFYANFSLGPKYEAMDPDRLEVFSTVKEITGYLNVQAHHDKFTNLNAFRNLEIIGGRTTFEYFSSLYIVKTSLTSLGLRSLREIRSGSVAILENNNLCFATDILWAKIMKSTNHNTLLQKNKNTHLCHQEGFVCDSQCSHEGCWGKGNSSCLSCKNFQVEKLGVCVASCDPKDGFFRFQDDESGDNKCFRCDEECELTCTGPGPGKCDRCKNSKDGPFCVNKCPKFKYRDSSSGECFPCHENCIEGCSGPENNIGPSGCTSCEKAIINADSEVVECLKEQDPCPDGYYESVPSNFQAKAICRPCHPLCKSCTGYGFNRNVCHECVGFLENEQCRPQCSADYYASGKTCHRCANECRGCVGPEVSQCKSCKNYKIFEEGGDPQDNATAFVCTQTCPGDYPHKIFTDQEEDPYCSATPYHLTTVAASSTNAWLIGGITLAIFFTIIFIIGCWSWQRRAKAKEKTAKMAMVMTGYEDSEPLRPTNIRPNLANLQIVKEEELRMSDIPLGCGAFGTVYKGAWIPQGENVKIPVAIKVLNPGTTPNENKGILEEAYIMASVNHPNLLQLLAVCMKSQMMIVTQLMPLGCLLDYVRNNKSKIGSKPLLNWSLQIARGMEYLEDHCIVHRDLAARNVLVQSPDRVKITDFGLARLLDVNEDEYKADGGKMPIKWLALECIQHRTFTHKSDVWAFGVTVWELLTYGAKPYNNIQAREVPDLLEKGERLVKPEISSLEVYMILIKCWQADAEARPSFHNLVKEFAKMASDPGRWLCINGDKYMRLPSYTKTEETELIRNMSAEVGGSERLVNVDDYFNPDRMASSHTLHTPVDTPIQPSTPTQQFFPPNMPPPSYDTLRGATANTTGRTRRGSRYGSQMTVGGNEAFNTLGSRSLRDRNNIISSSCDPLRFLEDDHVSSLPSVHSQRVLCPPPPGRNSKQRNNSSTGCGSTVDGKTKSSSISSSTASASSASTNRVDVAGLRLDLPVDDDDYLVPSPQTPGNPMQQQQHLSMLRRQQQLQHQQQQHPRSPSHTNPYMDLLAADQQNKGSSSASSTQKAQPGQTMFPYPPPQGYFLTDNPSNYGRVPDMHPFSAGVISMDNPEYILNEQQQRSNSSNRGNYHTLGIPILPTGQSNNNSSPGSSQGPSSIHSAPGAANTNGLPMPQPPPVFLAAPPPGRHATTAGLNGAVMKVPRTPGAGSHPRSSSAEESDEHDYYNDVDRIKRKELQPLHPNGRGGNGMPSAQRHQPPQQQQTTMPPLPGLQPISKHETTV